MLDYLTRNDRVYHLKLETHEIYFKITCVSIKRVIRVSKYTYNSQFCNIERAAQRNWDY